MTGSFFYYLSQQLAKNCRNYNSKKDAQLLKIKRLSPVKTAGDLFRFLSDLDTKVNFSPNSRATWREDQIYRLITSSGLKSAAYGVFLITSKVLDARRRGATTEAYGVIRRKEERSKSTRQMMP